MSATITVICYKCKVLSNGESPLMLRVINSVSPLINLAVSFIISVLSRSKRMVNMTKCK
ncbi:MAG: hypothetical protein GQ525_15430 [Draconibacterium sp.]|nr:hypothetical protein [Draconibacterium sp.]